MPKKFEEYYQEEVEPTIVKRKKNIKKIAVVENVEKAEEVLEKVEGKTKKTKQYKAYDTNTDVFVSGIPYEANEDQIREIFKDCGKIQYGMAYFRLIKLPRYQDSGRCRGYCHVRFSSKIEAYKAVTKDGVTMGTRYLKVQIAAGEKPIEQTTEYPPFGCKTIFVKNLPYDSTEEQIQYIFKRFGKIYTVRMVYDAHHKHFKGFCYIDYNSPSSLKGGLKMNGKAYQGRRLIVQFCTKGPRKGYKGFKKYQS